MIKNQKITLAPLFVHFYYFYELTNVNYVLIMLPIRITKKSLTHLAQQPNNVLEKPRGNEHFSFHSGQGRTNAENHILTAQKK